MYQLIVSGQLITSEISTLFTLNTGVISQTLNFWSGNIHLGVRDKLLSTKMCARNDYTLHSHASVINFFFVARYNLIFIVSKTKQNNNNNKYNYI